LNNEHANVKGAGCNSGKTVTTTDGREPEARHTFPALPRGDAGIFRKGEYCTPESMQDLSRLSRGVRWPVLSRAAGEIQACLSAFVDKRFIEGIGQLHYSECDLPIGAQTVALTAEGLIVFRDQKPRFLHNGLGDDLEVIFDSITLSCIGERLPVTMSVQLGGLLSVSQVEGQDAKIPQRQFPDGLDDTKFRRDDGRQEHDDLVLYL
jgi:hypothetical protein